MTHTICTHCGHRVLAVSGTCVICGYAFVTPTILRHVADPGRCNDYMEPRVLFWPEPLRAGVEAPVWWPDEELVAA